MHFDWYQASLPELRATELLEILHAGLGGELKDRGRGMNGYTNSYTINGPEGVRCTICIGGYNLCPNAFASGNRTEPFVELVRDHWPGNHDVSRVDSAEDFSGADCWEKLSAACKAVADRLGLKVHSVGDFHRELDGRTLYIGSRKSPCFVRLYEKGKQMRNEDRLNAEQYPLDWVRLEAQIHPKKDNRLRAATLSPLEVWGLSKTTYEVASACFNEKVARINVGRHDKSEHERSMNHAAYQYGNIFTKERDRLGGWPAFGESIHKRIVKAQAIKIRKRV